MTTDELLTTQEVAERLKVHINTVYNYIDAGKLQVIKLDGTIRIRVSALERFLSERTTSEK